MLPRTLSTRQVSESGDFGTAFLMVWSDVPLMGHQHCLFSWRATEFESKSFSSLFCQQKMAYIFGTLHIFPYGGSTLGSKWSLWEGFHPQIANVTENVWIAGLEVGSWKTWRNCQSDAFLREDNCCTISPLCSITQLWQFVRFSRLQGLNESSIGRFAFAHFSWCDTWKQRRHVGVRMTSCNLTLSGQMLPDSSNVVAAFWCFWSSCTHGGPALSFSQESCVEVNLMIFSLQIKDHIHRRLCYFSTRWLWAVSLPPGSKWRRCAEHKKVNVIEIHSSCSDWFDDTVLYHDVIKTFTKNPWIWV